DVDEAADGVGAVEQCRGAAHDFDAGRRSGIHVDAVITGLARNVAHAEAVLDDQHAIAVEASDDWTRGSRAEAAERDAWLVLQRRAESRLHFPGQFPPREHVGRVETLERALAFGTHRRHFAEMQLRVYPNIGGLGTRVH